MPETKFANDVSCDEVLIAMLADKKLRTLPAITEAVRAPESVTWVKLTRLVCAGLLNMRVMDRQWEYRPTALARRSELPLGVERLSDLIVNPPRSGCPR